MTLMPTKTKEVGQPLNFGDLNVYGARLIDNGSYVQAERANAYLDSGKKSWIGCLWYAFWPSRKVPNWCNPSSDDNLQANEVLGFCI